MNNPQDKPLWFSILKAKYFPSCSPMFARASGASQFWRDLVKLRPTFQGLVKFVIGNGKSTRFWLDWWCGASPLASTFPVLFSYCPNPQISISELASNYWDLQLRRSLSPAELEDWQRLAALFPSLSEEEDTVVWPHSPSARFSVKSLYGKLIAGSTTSKFNWIWRARIPPKVKVFLWQASRGRLPTGDQIRKRNDPGSDRCALCGMREDTSHIFFNCVLANLFWCCIRSWLHVSWAPTSFADLRALANSLVGAQRRLFWVGFAAMCWSLWTTRNKFTIEHVFPAKPADCLFKTCIFLQQWRLLTKEEDRDAFDDMAPKIRATATSLSQAQTDS